MHVSPFRTASLPCRGLRHEPHHPGSFCPFPRCSLRRAGVAARAAANRQPRTAAGRARVDHPAWRSGISSSPHPERQADPHQINQPFARMNVIAPFPLHSRVSALPHDGGAAGIGRLSATADHVAREAVSAQRCDWSSLTAALALLGPVLHVDAHAPGAPAHLPDGAPWPARSELVGLVCATHVAASVRLDSDGPGEALHFLDGHGGPLASLWLLPDSDFLVWEALIAHLPTMPMPQSGWQCGQCATLRGRARVCCFQSIRVTRGTWLDAVAPTRLSGIGQMRARRLAQAAGASLLA